MTQDEIMKMARKAGFADSNGVIHAAYQLESFAALVASAEREACAKVCEDVRDKYSSLEDPAERIAVEWCLDLIRDRGQA
jgi:hypothetical protein